MRNGLNEKKQRMKPLKNSSRRGLFSLLMMSPLYLLVIVFILVPIILMVVMSFTKMGLTLQWDFIGLQNYTKMFANPKMKEIIFRTLSFVVVNTVLSVAGSIFIVVITTYYLDIVYRRENLGLLYRIIWLLPSLTPSVVYAFIWKFVFRVTDAGLLNGILVRLGMDTVPWFSVGSLPILMFVCCLSSASGSIILFSSAVRHIPDSVIQAARVDGASNLYICRRIVLPYLRWPITQKTLWNILGFFCTYEIIKLLTEGGPMGKTTIYSYYIYQNAYNLKTFGMGAALSVFLVALSCVMGLIVLRLFKVDKQLNEPRMDI